MNEVTLDHLRSRDPRLDRRLNMHEASAADLAALVRSGLVAFGYPALNLAEAPLHQVPEEIWALHGMAVHPHHLLRAARWLPTWLDHHGMVAPDEGPARRERVRPRMQVPADPFYARLLNRSEYTSAGQRDATRALAVATSGDTITCVLPTASGKSEVFLARALSSRPKQTLVIVPTVALAYDLERRVNQIPGCSGTHAYSGQLDPTAKQQFASRISRGSQWLTITSPEAASTILATPLREAAQRGNLDLIAIDEAHVVADWGEDFRPAFQVFAGLHRRLIEDSPQGLAPVTALLTGTLDTYGWSTLRRLFPGTHDVLITSQYTRPEPAYWFAECRDEADKEQKFLEALRRLPRPALVYTALSYSEQSSNVQSVVSWLRKAGFAAVGAVTGAASAKERKDAVSGLRLAGGPEADLDVVVATSAFGVGIDVPDVRTVIHVCLPESVDRLYQEVGRSGRDGRASTSLVLWTRADQRVAERLAQARLIGPDLAWERWSGMRAGVWRDGELTVDLRAAHDGVRYPSSEANRYWNIQTLAAMERAGMIEWRFPEPPQIAVETDDDAVRLAFEDHRASARVILRKSDIGAEDVFLTRLADARRSALESSSAGLAAATEIVHRTSECTNRYLARSYRIAGADGSVLFVSVACGGCPSCRAQGIPRTLPSIGDLAASWGQLHNDVEADLAAVGPGRRLTVRRGDHDRRAERELLTRVVRKGVHAIVGSSRQIEQIRIEAARPWWIDEVGAWVQSDEPWQVPTVLSVDDDIDDDLLTRALRKLSSQPFGLVLVSPDRRDPRSPKHYLHEAWTPAYDIDNLLRRL